jgi:hypothetical protein
MDDLYFLNFAPQPYYYPPPPKPNVRLEIDQNSWMIGEVVISRHVSEPSGPCWSDGKGAFFTISEAPNPKPPTRPISDACPIKDHLIYEPSPYGVFEIGLAYLAIYPNKGTPEHLTLEALAKMSLSFQVPKAYYHGVHNDLYYIVYSALPGRTICEVWPETNDLAVKKRWLEQIVDTCVELSAVSGQSMTGITGDPLAELWLSKDNAETPGSYTPDVLLQNCQDIGMDCSNLVFQQNNLTPLTFTIDESGKLLGIYHWQDAGFLPKDWIATKGRFNSSLLAVNRMRSWPRGEGTKWASGINYFLRERGFRPFSIKHNEWRTACRREREERERETVQDRQKMWEMEKSREKWKQRENSI